MLDALVNEAQIRWGLDLSQGLQVVPGEWLAAVPVEPSRPLILAPLGSSAGAGPGRVGGCRVTWRTGARGRVTRCRVATARAA